MWNLTRKLAATVAFALLAPAIQAGTYKLEDWMVGALAIRDDSDELWKVNLGIGAGMAPAYPGSGDYQAVPLPLIDAEYMGKLFASTARGVGYAFYNQPSSRAGFRMTIDYGRNAKDNPRISSLGDVPPTYEAGFFFEGYKGPWRTKFDFRQGLNGHEGIVGSLDLAHARRLDEHVVMLLGVKGNAGNENYMNAFYGVPANNRLKQHPAHSGFEEVSAYTSYIYQFNRNVYWTFDARVSQLVGGAKSSPVTEDSLYFYFGTIIGYRF